MVRPHHTSRARRRAMPNRTPPGILTRATHRLAGVPLPAGRRSGRALQLAGSAHPAPRGGASLHPDRDLQDRDRGLRPDLSPDHDLRHRRPVSSPPHGALRPRRMRRSRPVKLRRAPPRLRPRRAHPPRLWSGGLHLAGRMACIPHPRTLAVGEGWEGMLSVSQVPLTGGRSDREPSTRVASLAPAHRGTGARRRPRTPAAGRRDPPSPSGHNLARSSIVGASRSTTQVALVRAGLRRPASGSPVWAGLSPAMWRCLGAAMWTGLSPAVRRCFCRPSHAVWHVRTPMPSACAHPHRFSRPSWTSS